MRPWIAVAVAAAAIAALATPSVAQSLAEVAARTKKKEEGKAKPAKVYTETDLRGRPAAGSMSAMEGPVTEVAASPAPGAATAAPAGVKAKTDDELHAEKQTEWREKLQHAESEVTRLSEEIARAQTALNDLTGALYGGARTGLINRVEEGKRNLAIVQQTVVDLQEEGRKSRFR